MPICLPWHAHGHGRHANRLLRRLRCGFPRRRRDHARQRLDTGHQHGGNAVVLRSRRRPVRHRVLRPGHRGHHHRPRHEHLAAGGEPRNQRGARRQRGSHARIPADRGLPRGRRGPHSRRALKRHVCRAVVVSEPDEPRLRGRAFAHRGDGHVSYPSERPGETRVHRKPHQHGKRRVEVMSSVSWTAKDVEIAPEWRRRIEVVPPRRGLFMRAPRRPRQRRRRTTGGRRGPLRHRHARRSGSATASP